MSIILEVVFKDSTIRCLVNESNYLTLTITVQAQKTMHGTKKATGD